MIRISHGCTTYSINNSLWTEAGGVIAMAKDVLSNLRVGTAGWSVPSALGDRFPAEGTHLQRYAARFPAVEINSSFYRPHRRTTYARWAASVPEHFRFAVKLPKTITHERRFDDSDDLVARFAEEVGGLGEKRGPVLVQLPPSFAYPGDMAESFFAGLATGLGGFIACEPRHPSWFAPEVDAMLVRQRVARVAADPAPVPEASRPGGWAGLAYIRLHGSPTIYWSAYDEADVATHARGAAALAKGGAEVWVVYDNTAAGAAPENALGFMTLASNAAENGATGAPPPR
jgi:uncharacterized protein YecE (DUF72 family)